MVTRLDLHIMPPMLLSPQATLTLLCVVKTVQSSDSGAPTFKLPLPENYSAPCCCFSPDGNLTAVASNEVTYVWNIARSVPKLVATFSDHDNIITSLTFTSPSSLISGFWDDSIKFWQVGVSSTDPVATNLESTPPTSFGNVVVSLQAKEGIAISGNSNGVVIIWGLLAGLCKASFQIPVINPIMDDVHLIDGKLLYAWSKGGKIHIWDSQKGKWPQTLNSDHSVGLRISGDGSKIFNVNWHNSVSTIQVWSVGTGELACEVHVDDGKKYYLDTFHAGGSKVWVQSEDLTTKGWNFETLGSSPLPLPNIPSERPYLNLWFSWWYIFFQEHSNRKRSF